MTLLLLMNVARATDDQTDIAKRLDASAKVLDEVMANPNKSIPDGVIKRATFVAVFPATLQVAVLVGRKHGKGFATCRTENESSAPAPLTVSGGSWGAPLGGQEVDLVMVITTEKGMQQLLSGKFNLGTETSVTAGPVGNHEWKVNGDVLTYARARGALVGFNLAGVRLPEATMILISSMETGILSDRFTGKRQATAASQTFLSTGEKYAGRSKARD